MCALACRKKIIEIRLDEDGFYAPIITDNTQCTNCGMCIDVCSFHNGGLSVKPETISSYAAWSKDAEIRKHCSSGGVAFEISKKLISEGYKVCGVKYNVESNRAEHYIANNVEELIPSIGSKYLQSYTVDGFKQLNIKDKFLVIGTPCQIDSLRRIIRKRKCEDNYILIDFFCHGVPSNMIWKYYLKLKERENGKVLSIRWRDKRFGWHKSYVMVTNHAIGDKCKQKEIYSNIDSGDLFLNQFLGNTCLGKACYYDCKYKQLHSSADIRIGDFWGKKFKNNDDGVNSVIAFSKKGQVLISLLKDSCQIEEVAIKDAVAEQMTSNATRGFTTPIVKFIVSHDFDLYPFLWNILINIERSYKTIRIKCQKLK